MATLSFLGLTNTAYDMVNKKYPGSKLLEADGITPKGVSNDPKDFTDWRFIFRTPDGGTAFLHAPTWGEFKPMTYTSQAWLEDMEIPWPIKMDLVEADNILKRAGHKTGYKDISLRWPLFPGNTEPYYIFTMEDGHYVFVGVRSKRVRNVESTA